MSEQIDLDKLTGQRDWLNVCFFKLVSGKNQSQFDSIIQSIKNSKMVDIEVKINGVEFLFSELVESLSNEFDFAVKREAGEKIQEVFGEKINSLRDLLHEAERDLRDKLRANDFIPQDED